MKPLLSDFITIQRLDVVVPYLSGNILDLGCGYTRIPALLKPDQTYVGIDQDPLLLVSGKSPPKGLSLLDVLPNPRRNPAFFGVPESRRIKIGGVYDPESGTVVGGREANVHLVKDGKDPAEFGKAYQRYKKGEDGFKMFIDDYSLTTFGSDRPYYTITGLGAPHPLGSPLFGSSSCYRIKASHLIQEKSADPALAYAQRADFRACRIVGSSRAGPTDGNRRAPTDVSGVPGLLRPT